MKLTKKHGLWVTANEVKHRKKEARMKEGKMCIVGDNKM
jgi:hypothetical protein